MASTLIAVSTLAACGAGGDTSNAPANEPEPAAETAVPSSTLAEPEDVTAAGFAPGSRGVTVPIETAEGEDSVFHWAMDAYHVVEDPDAEVPNQCPGPSLPEAGTTYVSFSVGLEDVGRANGYASYLEVGLATEHAYEQFALVGSWGVSNDLDWPCVPVDFADAIGGQGIYMANDSGYAPVDSIELFAVIEPDHELDGVVVARIFHERSMAYVDTDGPPTSSDRFYDDPILGVEIATIPLFTLSDPLGDPGLVGDLAEIDARITQMQTPGAASDGDCVVTRYPDMLFSSLDYQLNEFITTDPDPRRRLAEAKESNLEKADEAFSVSGRSGYSSGDPEGWYLVLALDDTFGVHGESPNPYLIDDILGSILGNSLDEWVDTLAVWRARVDAGCPEPDGTGESAPTTTESSNDAMLSAEPETSPTMDTTPPDSTTAPQDEAASGTEDEAMVLSCFGDYWYNDELPLYPCQEGFSVTLVQLTLWEYGWDVDDDGLFGPGTQTAVMDFQRQWGLPVTGIVDAETWIALDPVLPGPGSDLNGDGAIDGSEISFH